MTYALIFGFLLYCYAVSPKFRATAHVVLGVGSVLAFLILLSTGFMGPFFAALASIPIDLASGIFGLLTAWLA